MRLFKKFYDKENIKNKQEKAKNKRFKQNKKECISKLKTSISCGYDESLYNHMGLSIDKEEDIEFYNYMIEFIENNYQLKSTIEYYGMNCTHKRLKTILK